MIVKIFIQDTCPNCPAAKLLGKKLEKIIPVEYHDMKSIDGLSMAVNFDIMTTPTILITNNKNVPIFSWQNNMPTFDEAKKKINKIKSGKYKR